MRQERTVQATIFEVFAGHQIGCERKANLGRARWAVRAGEPGGGRSAARGSAPDRAAGAAGGNGAALRSLAAAAAAQNEELAFHLKDSASFRAFARLPLGWSPKKSVLHRTISAIRA
jgi:IS5 family transposase